MKFIYAVGIAVLLGIVAAWWFTGSENEIDATPGPAVSSDFDASQELSGNVETLQRQESRQQFTPSGESTAGRDVGSDSATTAPAGGIALSKPGTQPVVLHEATETTPGLPADSKSSQPSAIDKTACEAAARTLKESSSIFDLTPTQAIHYASNRAPVPHARPSAFDELKARLLAPLCSGTEVFSQDFQAAMEFVAVSPDSYARFLVGDHWISDGTVLSQLSELDQGFFADSFIQSRRGRGGPNMSRESFERKLARNPRGLLVGP